MKTLKFYLPDPNGFNIEDKTTPTADYMQQDAVDALINAGYSLAFEWKENCYDAYFVTEDELKVPLTSWGTNNIIWNLREGRISR